MKSRDREKDGTEHFMGQRSSDLQVLQLTNNKRYSYITVIRVKDAPLRAQSSYDSDIAVSFVICEL